MQFLGTVASPVKIHPDLPIHRLQSAGSCVYYAPGHIAVCGTECSPLVDAAVRGEPSGFRAAAVADALMRAASGAVQRWRELAKAPFRPEALTAHLWSACNCSCTYCYSRLAAAVPSAQLDLGLLGTAVRLVAESCAGAGRDLTVAFHGGGEPALDVQRLVAAVSIARREAERTGVRCVALVASNGLFPAAAAGRLAQAFEQITISIDGPPDIQDAQRPLAGGGRSSPLVERNLRLLADFGANLAARVTITPQTIHRQAGIVQYLSGFPRLRRINLEPVFAGQGNSQPWSLSDAEPFAARFVEAKALGTRLGCLVATSCVRMEELHGPYCDTLRHTVLLGAAGVVAPCTFRLDRDAACGKLRRGGDLELDVDQLTAMRRAAAAVPDECADCINALHCARACPGNCYLESGRPRTREFRCRVALLLSVHRILNSVESAKPEEADGAVLRDDAVLGDLSLGPLRRLVDEPEVEVERSGRVSGRLVLRENRLHSEIVPDIGQAADDSRSLR